MGLEQRHSAKRIVAIVMGCSWLAWIAVTATALPDPLPNSPYRSHAEMAYYIAVLVIAVAALVLMYVALESFKRGVTNELWAEVALERLRTELNRPVWNVLTTILVVAALGYVFYDLTTWGNHLHRHHTNGGLIYFWLSPLTAYSQLKAALRPPPPPRGSVLWLDDLKPLHSNHWGER
jgi:hypothetical protein